MGCGLTYQRIGKNKCMSYGLFLQLREKFAQEKRAKHYFYRANTTYFSSPKNRVGGFVDIDGSESCSGK